MQPEISTDVRVRTVPDIGSATTPAICGTIDALSRKRDQQTSKNVFLIVHPFDAVAARRADPATPLL